MSAIGMVKTFAALFSFASKIKDPDDRAEFHAIIAEAQAQVRIAELNTKTIPLVDAIHKMWRPMTTSIASAAPMIIYFIKPDIDFNTLALLTGSIAGPTGLYTLMKGKGR